MVKKVWYVEFQLVTFQIGQMTSHSELAQHQF